jgi:ABC-type dipeptide/oligopeptide/nickel transport system permease component
VPTLLAISALVFLMQVLVPGDPVDVMTLGQQIDVAGKEALRRELGLDRPVPIQYLSYLAGLLRLDLGTSVRNRQPVLDEIRVRYPNTLLLAFTSLAVAVLLGLVTGILGAVYQGTFLDFATAILATLGLSIPAFWLGLLLMFQFGVNWRLLPVMGYGSWRHLVLPALTLGLIYAAAIARMVRSSLLDVLRLDYIRTARSKGLAERRVLFRHALMNAMIPVVTIVGLQLGALLGGAFIIEVVFAFPGIGELAIKAIQFRDFPVIQGVTLVIAVTTVLVNLAVDILYGLLNPQIQYA